MMKSFQNLWAKAGIERLLSDPNKFFLSLFLLFLPTQLGLHFWPTQSFVNGIRVDYLSPTLYFTDLLIIVLILINIKNIRATVKKIKLSKTNNLVIAAVLLSIFTSILLSEIPILGVFKLIKVAELFLLGFVLYINRDNLLNLFPKIIPITIIFESLLAFAQFINKGSLNGIFYFLGERMFNSQTPNIANANILGELILRPYGTLPHPNVLAGFLLIATTYLLFNSNFEKNAHAKIAVIFGGFGILLSLSRISTTLFVIVVLVFFAKRKLLKINKDRIVFCGLIILSGAFLLLSPIRDRFVVNSSDTSIVQRQLLLNSATEMIKDSPLFGVGLNNFLPSLPNFYKAKEFVFYLQPVHNLPLLIFSEIGIIAGVLVLYLYFLIFMRTNFESKLLLFLIATISIFDHYFLTLQQGQLLLTLAVVLSFIKTSKIDARMKTHG